MWKEYENLIMERSRALIDEDLERAKKINDKINEVSKNLTKEDLENLLKNASSYQEKNYWSNRIKEL